MKLNITFAPKEEVEKKPILLEDCAMQDVVRLCNGQIALVVSGSGAMKPGVLSENGRAVVILSSRERESSAYTPVFGAEQVIAGKGEHRIVKILGTLSGIEVAQKVGG